MQPPRPDTSATAIMSYHDMVAFLHAHGATDYPARYRINAAGIFNTTNCALIECDTHPVYEQLGVAFGAELTITPTQVTVVQHVLFGPG